MKIIKLVLLSTLLALSAGSLADTYPPTRTYETTVQKLRMPATPSGTIALRECSDCDFERFRVTARTVYTIDNKSMQLDDFRDVVEDLRQRGDQYVNVTRDIASDTIIKVFFYTY